MGDSLLSTSEVSGASLICCTYFAAVRAQGGEDAPASRQTDLAPPGPSSPPTLCPAGHWPALRVEVNRLGRLRVTGLNKSEAEDLLDWLEAQGVRGCKATYVGGEGFSVWYS